MPLVKKVWDEFYKNKFYIVFAFSFLVQLLAYGYSLITAYFFNAPFSLPRLTRFIIILAAFYVLQSFLAGMIKIYSENKSRVYQRSLRRRSLITILNMPSEKIIEHGLQLIKEIVTDANNQMYTIVSSYLTNVVNMAVGLIVLTVSLSRQSVWVSMMALVLIAITVFVQSRLLKKKIKLAKEYFNLNSGYRAMVSDIQNNSLTIKKLNAEEYFAQKLDTNSKSVDAKGLEKIAYDVRCQWIFDAFTYSILFLILINIARSLRQDPAYDALFWVVFYTGIFAQLKSQISAVTQTIQNLVDFRISMHRYDDLMSESDGGEVAPLHHKWRDITAENLDFTYQSSGRHVHVDRFYIQRGDHISLTGPSGSGKSTLLGILSGQLEPDSGKISYDTRKRTRIVPYIEDCVFISQSLNLFKDTLRNNLCLGREYSDGELYALLERAGLKQWAQTLPNGLESMISENAANLSDGQKMRIKILRGILGEREIVIMDEPSSNLDSVSNEQIQQLIKNDLAGKTIIIATHDDELVKICNRHYVSDKNGNISEIISEKPGIEED